MILTEKDSGRQIPVARGTTVTLRLRDESASAGYQWLVASAQGVELLRQTTEPGAAPGAAGVRIFDFAVRAPGRHVLALVQRRAWEPEESEIARFEVTLVAE